ncbi:MAG: HsdR family type I site-specific deoxyribonuclease [Candidatus Altiarchaeota archaeon]|nr:HsdR family type I site-specific deoxyribonuclease [Candidatus Altiarchaeota archaeon]
MPRFNEKSLVEDYLVEQLEGVGWSFIPANKLDRSGFDEPLLVRDLIRKIKETNPFELSDEDINTVLNELRFRPSTEEGVRQILSFFRDGVPIKLEKDRSLKKVRLFDYDKIDRNEFVVTRQAAYTSGDREIRTDIILYVNGIPLVDIECKNPASFSESWFNAFKQVKDYEEAVPEIYKYIQVGVAAEQMVKYFPIVPWLKDVKIEEWRSGEKYPLDSVIDMLSPETFMDILGNFIYVRAEYGEVSKVLPRYMQHRAVNKVVNRVLDNLNGKEPKNRGLVWHWQGSGKTLEMIYAANKLYRSEKLGNPTIFMIVDRQDLEEQLYGEFTALDMVLPEIISSVSELRKVLEHDGGRGKRGVFITLIHKFRSEELKALENALKDLSKDRETIITRKNVIAFIDEGHRTQYGVLASQMKSILKNAFFFAFTGTPISKPRKGVDTYREFSYPNEGEKYLDKYFITDSIRDEFTVKIAYQPRLEKEVHLNKEMLDAFLEVEFEELPVNVRDVVKDEVKKRISLIRAYLENPERIALVAKDIAEHFKENVDGKFKAMVVAVSREACVIYKRELDRHLPEDYSDIIFSYGGRGEPERIQKYVREETAQYGEEYDDLRKKVVNRYEEEDLPKILIVTDMLLTGFDAPILQTMYLDKPLKEHRLLQAVARTNRPYKGVKEAGLIIDYLGILKEFKRAFEVYSKEEIKGALFSPSELRKDFSDLLNKLLDIFRDIPKNQYDRETLLSAIEILTSDEEKSKSFINGYARLEKLFELLGPDTIKAELFSEYQWITAIYIYYSRMVFRKKPGVGKYVNQYFNKTIKYIHKTTELEELQKSLPVLEFDENYLRNLEEKVKSREEKAANIVFTLNRFVLVDKYRNPVSESLSDKVERLLELWREKTKDYERVYNDGVKLMEEYAQLSKRQKELGLNKMEYSLFLLLEESFKGETGLDENVKELSASLKEHTFPCWISQPTAQKNVEKAIRLFLRKYVKKHRLSVEELNGLYEKVIDRVKAYGKEN